MNVGAFARSVSRQLGAFLPRALLALGILVGSLSVASAQDDPAATRQYNTAVGLHNSEAHELAIGEWTQFIADFPNDPRVPKAMHYRGVCYTKTGKLDKAVEAFSAVVTKYPQFELLGDTLLNLGLTQYNVAQSGEAKLYDEAAATFKKLITQFPKGKYLANALFYHGECLYNRGKAKEAVAKYEKVVADYAGHALESQAMFALGVAQADLGEHDAALANYGAFLKKFPKDPLVAEAKVWQGESLYAKGKYAEAAEVFASSAADVEFAMADYATVRRADCFSALKQHAEAATAYASVATKYPKSQYAAVCQLEAGKKYYAAGEMAKAREWLNRVIAAGGASLPEAAHWTARSLLKDGKPAEALAVVEKALPIAEKAAKSERGKTADLVSLMVDRADAVYELPSRRGEAVALYAAVATAYPSDSAAPQSLYMAGFAAMNEADYPTAIKHATGFLAAHGDHELGIGAKHVLAESSLLSGKYAEAGTLYEELLTAAPKDQDADVWKVHRGTALYLQKEYQAAIDALLPVMAGIESPELAAEGWYRVGRGQLVLRKFATAAGSLEKSLAQSGKWQLADDARIAAAYAYQQTKGFAKAREHAQAVIDRSPDGKLAPAAHYRLGECLRLDGGLKDAVAHYGQLLDKWPNDALVPSALYGLGWAHIGLGDHEAAEQALSTLLDKQPAGPLAARAKYGRGMARRQLKKYAEAAEDLQGYLAGANAMAEKSQARHLLGLCFKGQEKHDDAVATFALLLEEDPDYADADSIRFEAGWSLKLAGKNDEAAAMFGELVAAAPKSSLAADAYCLIGDVHYAKKGYKKAASAYHKAMLAAGKTPLGEEASYKLGLGYYMLDDMKNAQQSFHYQRLTWPKGPLATDGAFMEAESFFKQGEYKKALPIYDLVKKPSSEEVAVMTLLHAGHAAGQVGQWKQSLERLTECVDKYPKSPHFAQALYEQGWAQQNLDQLDDAVATYEKVIAQSDKEPAARAQFKIGEIQFQRKQHAEAIKSFFKVSFGYGYPKWQADATYEAARCFEVLGQKGQALKQYQKLVESFPKSDKLDLAKERIAALQ